MQTNETAGANLAGTHTAAELPALRRPALPATPRGRFFRLLRYLGPAFVVSVAYIDPGNFATNISAGSRFGYALLWVVLWSNLAAVFLQTMSAKVGIATGLSLPEMCARAFPVRLNRVFWAVAELGAMATDLAEFLGGTLGLNLLFRIPILAAGLLTGLLTYLICCLEKYGQKAVELLITALVAVIGASYLLELLLAKPDWAQTGLHALLPALPGGGALELAVGMLGATVMPHVIYLHSQLVQARGADQSEEGKRRHLKMEKIDILIAMNTAFLVNAAMVVVSAAVFFKGGLAVTTMEQAHRSLEPLLGPLSSGVFGVALLASGLSSSAVGTMAGQSIMKGFIGLRIPAGVRRLVTMLPALAVIAAGVSPMEALIASQVALSFILPVPIVQMLAVAGSKKWMGSLANSRRVQAVGILIAAAVTALNAALLFLTFTGNA